MVTKKLRTKDLVNLFNRYNLNTLNSIGYLLKQGISNPDVASAYKSVYAMKYNSNKGYATNSIFDISEVIDSMESLSPSEIDYLYNVINSASKKINKDDIQYKKISSDIDKFMDIYNELSLFWPKLERVDEYFTDDELRDFFRKYDARDLESFKLIFNYVYDYDLVRMHEIYEEIYDEKLEELEREYEVTITPLGYGVSNMANKNSKLSLKELEMLYKITESSTMCLDSIDHIDVEYEYSEVSTLNDKINEEIEDRKTHIKKIKKL